MDSGYWRVMLQSRFDGIVKNTNFGEFVQVRKPYNDAWFITDLFAELIRWRAQSHCLQILQYPFLSPHSKQFIAVVWWISSVCTYYLSQVFLSIE